jgi:hypothetical protein
MLIILIRLVILIVAIYFIAFVIVKFSNFRRKNGYGRIFKKEYLKQKGSI